MTPLLASRSTMMILLYHLQIKQITSLLSFHNYIRQIIISLFYISLFLKIEPPAPTSCPNLPYYVHRSFQGHHQLNSKGCNAAFLQGKKSPFPRTVSGVIIEHILQFCIPHLCGKSEDPPKQIFDKKKISHPRIFNTSSTNMP